MIFRFLKYVNPIWYFNLKPNVDFGYFPTIEQLKEQSVNFELDNRYQSDVARDRDASWSAFQRGFINKKEKKGIDVWDDKIIIPIVDEYIFIRKNFSKFWILYVLFVRICTLNNPIKELFYFFKTRNITRINFSNNINYKEYDTFESDLLKENPLVSVIIPTLNRYDYLIDVFKDLEKQTYKNFEVIVVDQTDNFQESFYENWNFKLHFWFQSEKALWKARNEAIQFSKGDYLLLYDDDSLIDKDWIEQHLKTLDYFNADLSSGVSISKIGGEVPQHYNFFRWSDQLDTGNVLIKRKVFDNIGFFDRQFEKQRMGDGEYGLRAYLYGFKNISNYKAKRIHLKVEKGGLRQMGSWDGWRPKNYFAPRPVPSVLYLSRKYFGNTLSRWYILSSILPSIVPYKYKKSRFLKLLTFLLMPFLLPLISYQVIKSWKLATLKINIGKI